jgi:Rps23 Pro-64 3,4-dihydroxylase Tpa1-like proline 4-hydroxylase
MSYLNPDLDIDALAARFAATNRLQIRDFFQPHVADAIRRHVMASNWQLSYRDDSGDRNVTLAELDRMNGEQRGRLHESINDVARRKFQFAYFSNLVTLDAQRGDDHLLARMIRYMSGDEFLGVMRRITGDSSFNRLFGQATMYAQGNFLRGHNDEVEVEDRRFAFVLNLTQDWRPDWGGLLHFINDDMDVIDSFMPHFNSLSLFKVPQWHYVSYVAPYATTERYAVTGWLVA